MNDAIEIRALRAAELPAFIDYLVAHFDESGRDGQPGFSPYPRDHAFDPERMRDRFDRALGLAHAVVEWKRAWAAWSGDRVVGHLVLHGAQLPSQLHRTTLGMGVSESHRRRGIATRLVITCQGANALLARRIEAWD